MQYTIHTATNCRHPISWPLPGTSPIIKELIPSNRKLFFEKVSAYSSLRTSLDCESDGSIEEGLELASPVCLPFVIRSSTKVSRCFWDGECLKLVSIDGSASSFNFNSDNGFHKVLKICSSVLRDFFIPRQVTENYMDYVKWKFLHRVFSSSLQVLATQAMFRAIGIGYSSSLPSAAALNWVLKDGLGRLSRCIYTASLASAFDTNLKRVRFSTSVLFSASIGLELLTPVFPQYFLLLATIANIAKQISLACYLATRVSDQASNVKSAVHRTFAIADNLGEVSAKAQIQTVCFDNLGFMLAALLNLWFGNHERLRAGLHFFVYPIFTAMDLLGTYQGLKHIHLQTLTKDRLEIVLNTWIASGYVPSPAEVSDREGINFLGIKGKDLWPIRIGCLNSKHQIPKWSMMSVKCVTGKDCYFICTEIFSEGFKRTRQQGILLCLHEGAEAMDIIKGLLQVCYIRQTLLMSSGSNKWEYSFRESNLSDLALKEWPAIIEQSKISANRTSSNLIEQMLAMGWAVKSILLTAQEQVRYSFVND